MDQVHLCLEHGVSEELMMDAALAATSHPSSGPAVQHLFKTTATTAEGSATRRMGFVSLFSACSKHVSGASKSLSLDGLQGQVTSIRAPEELVDAAHGRGNRLCACYFLRQSYASAVEEWTVKQCATLCGEACRGACSACSIVVVGSNVFLAQTGGSLRVYRSSKAWKKLNVTHDRPSPSLDADEITPPRIVEFKIESEAAFVLVLSDSVTKAVTSAEAFDIVRASLQKRACSRAAAEALLAHIREHHRQSQCPDKPEDFICLVILWTSGRGGGFASLSDCSD